MIETNVEDPLVDRYLDNFIEEKDKIEVIFEEEMDNKYKITAKMLKKEESQVSKKFVIELWKLKEKCMWMGYIYFFSWVLYSFGKFFFVFFLFIILIKK